MLGDISLKGDIPWVEPTIVGNGGRYKGTRGEKKTKIQNRGFRSNYFSPLWYFVLNMPSRIVI